MTDSREVMAIRDILRSELNIFATQVLEVEMLNLQRRLRQGVRADFQEMFVDLQSALKFPGLRSTKTFTPSGMDLRSTATGPEAMDALSEKPIPASDSSISVGVQPAHHPPLLSARMFTPNSMDLSSTADGLEASRDLLNVEAILTPKSCVDEVQDYSNCENHATTQSNARSHVQSLLTSETVSPAARPDITTASAMQSPKTALTAWGMRQGSKGNCNSQSSEISHATLLTSKKPEPITTEFALPGAVASEPHADSASAFSSSEGAWDEKQGNEGELQMSQDTTQMQLVGSGCEYPGSPCSKKIVAPTKRRTSLGNADRSSSLALASKQPLRFRVLNMVNKPVFDYVVAGLILANGILVGIQTDYLARENLEDPPVFFQITEIVFCIIFTAELALRLFVFRCSFFTMSQRGWNVFDFAIVSLQLLETFMSLVSDWVGFSFNILRILRLMRIVRLVRALRLIGELRIIVASIAGSVKPVLWTGVLLFMLAYVVGVALVQLVHTKVLALIETGDPIPRNIERYWGNLLAAMLTLIQSITGGVDWDDVWQPLMETVGVEVALLFMLYILFSSLALLNVITGVFIDAVMENGKRNKQQCIQQHVQALFAALDVNPNGEIHWEDFERQLDRQEMKDFFSIVDVDISNARNLFELLDSDGSESVDTSELLDGCLRFWSPATNMDLRMISQDIGRLRKRTRELVGLVKSLREGSCCKDTAQSRLSYNDGSPNSDGSILM